MCAPIEACQDAGPTSRAYGCRDKCIGEAHALRCKSVQIGGADDRISCTPHRPGWLIVGDQNEDIRTTVEAVGGSPLGTRTARQETQQEDEFTWLAQRTADGHHKLLRCFGKFALT